MASRKRGNDSTDRARRSSKAVPSVWIFTEGTLTEPQYIDIVRDLRDPDIPLAVHIANDERTLGGTKGSARPTHSRKPLDLLDQAVTKLREENRKARREAWGVPPRGISRWTTVWCLFDRDQHEGVDEVMRVARKMKERNEGLEVAYSHPCFELWRLLHHKDYTSTFGGVCDDAAKRLPFVTPRTSKEDAKVVLPEQILKEHSDGYAKAKARAQRMNAQHGDHALHSNRDPYTDVWRFVEEGLLVTDY
ncbi:RloB domain-containing protein [Streptomyces sp. ISL-99]|uniref:RloB family protein n=1 Tax=Streptomyces sp. ISL-99 TaxID=2819193 RepID=UPI001BE92464|nr:RloB family protein [Streptomyces sp. ISL-99]MBT2526174.1 RloB domain-containing protein [Streptomyces sp. ISL-99]